MPEWIRCGTQAVAEATQGWEDHFPAWLPKAALPEPEAEPEPAPQPQSQQSQFEQVPSCEGVWSCEVVCEAAVFVAACGAVVCAEL